MLSKIFLNFLAHTRKGAFLEGALYAACLTELDKGLGAAEGYEIVIAFPFLFTTLALDHRPELKRNSLCETIVDVVERIMIDVELSLPACTCREAGNIG